MSPSHPTTPDRSQPVRGPEERRYDQHRYDQHRYDEHRYDERRHEEHGSVPSATAPALYALCAVLFLASLWLFGYSVDVDNGVLFWVAMALATLAFLLPMQLRPGVGRSR